MNTPVGATKPKMNPYSYFKTHCACAVSLCFFISSLFASLGAYASDIHPIGEKLTYKAYAVGVLPIGTVSQETFTSNFEGRTTYCFTGRCYGDYLVYLADVRLAAQVDRYSGQSLFHDLEQYGTERRGRKLLFDRMTRKMTYTRLEKDKVTYKVRRVIDADNDVDDIFGGAFKVRARLGSNVGDYTEVKLVETDKIFHLRVEVVEKTILKIKNVGNYHAMKVVIKPLNLKKEEVFKGLLELDRDVTIYLEEKTKTPLLISSTVPFGFVRPRITVTLSDWQTVPGFEPRPVTEEELKEFEGVK